MTGFELCVCLLLVPIVIASLSIARKLEDCLDAVNEILVEKRKGGEG